MQLLLQILGGRARDRALLSATAINTLGQSHHESEVRDLVMQFLTKCFYVFYNSI